MLRQRKGHLSSFRPAAGDLIQYLFLNLLRDITTGLYMKFMLTEHADETIGEKIVSSSTKKRKVSDKQLQALKNLAGFLSDEGGEGGSGSQGASTKNDGDGEVSTASEAADINKRNNAKKPAAKKKQSTAKVKPFTQSTVVHTPAVAKKINARGKGARKKPAGGSRKKTPHHNVEYTNGVSVNHAAMEEQKKMLESIQKATAEHKRASEDLAKQIREAKALKQKEGFFLKQLLWIIHYSIPA